MKLTEHFTLEEMNCKCNKCKGKTPPTKVFNNLKLLAVELEKMRVAVGKPITLTCAYRCEEHNAAVGGVKGSAHTLGLAADTVISGKTPAEMFEFMSKIKVSEVGKPPKGVFKGVGYYPIKGFCHVDIWSGGPRPNTWKG